MSTINQVSIVTTLLGEGLLTPPQAEFLRSLDLRESASPDETLTLLLEAYSREELTEDVEPFFDDEDETADDGTEDIEFFFDDEIIDESEVAEWDLLNDPAPDEYLIRFVEKLRELALITPDTAGVLAAWLQEKDDMFGLETEAEVVGAAREVEHYIRQLQPDSLHSFGETLYRIGLLDEKAHRHLCNDIDRGKFTEPDQIFDYVPTARHLHLYNSTMDKTAYLEDVYRQVADVLPELDFQDISFQLVPEHNYLRGSENEALQTTVTIGEQTYTSLSSDCLRYNNPASPRIDEHAFFELFNKVLRDTQSDYRLFMLRSFNPFVPSRPMGHYLLALTREQWEALLTSPIGHRISDTFEALDTDGINAIIDKYQRTGFFDHVSDEEFYATVDQLYQTAVYGAETIVFAFPNTFLSVYVVTAPHGQWLQESLEDLTNRLAGYTHGEFAPTDLAIGFDEETGYLYSFRCTCNNKQYELTEEPNVRQLLDRLVSLVNTVLQDTGSARQFRYRSASADAIVLVLTTPEQYETLCADGLIESGTTNIT